MNDGEEKTEILKIVNKPEPKSGEKDGKSWTRYMYEFENKVKASTFNVKLKDFKSGDNVKVMYKKTGLYYNILDMKLAEQSEIVTADKVKTQDPKVWLEKDRRITRMACNNAAIEILKLMNEIQPEKVKEVLTANSENIFKVLDMISLHFEDQVWRTQDTKIDEIEETVM